ncbi:FAD-binding protein [Pyxidicoccus fallax]|uniref:FAD-binding protein n=1 Tax=Pyxidicoccus fallax TaxID=394095 RepID=A0A848LRM1_9BACT|nr:FAD-dependent monooxygenase [Pyxidicoccus fallax]NMO20282.1 FAD-binding protein [Pyxidicoccus fallax]NPC81027.1 FAD-binding protein [Pyxidicoccus fallax]
MQSRGVIIIGGGVGGLCAAIALRQAGLEVAVYERAESYRALGAGLSLWPNAMRAFELLGVAREVAGAGVEWRETVMHRWDGKVLSRLAVDTLCRDLGQPTVGLLRAELHQVLLRALGPDVVHLGAACTGFHVGNDRVRVTFADGRQVEGDCLVGADGLHSVVRQQLFPEVRARYKGRTSWRGVVSVTSPVLPEGSQFELYGPGGARVGIYHMGRGPEGTWRMYWFLMAPAPAGGRDAEGGHREAVLSHVRGWAEPVESLIRSTPESAILRTDIHDLEPLPHWGDGPVTLLGDAAHAMVTDLAQGACQAIEDALVLAKHLRADSDKVRALRTYESRRRPRTAYVSELSLKAGSLRYLRPPLARWARDLLMQALPRSVALNTLRSVVSHDFLA